MNRTDLTDAQYAVLCDMFRAADAEAHYGEHEGVTLAVDGVYLCESDGCCWLATEPTA